MSHQPTYYSPTYAGSTQPHGRTSGTYGGRSRSGSVSSGSHHSGSHHSGSQYHTSGHRRGSSSSQVRPVDIHVLTPSRTNPDVYYAKRGGTAYMYTSPTSRYYENDRDRDYGRGYSRHEDHGREDHHRRESRRGSRDERRKSHSHRHEEESGETSHRDPGRSGGHHEFHSGEDLGEKMRRLFGMKPHHKHVYRV